MNLKELEVIELLRLQADVTKELKRRNIVRTQNNPLGDYTEWLVAQKMNLALENNSAAGYDAKSEAGVTFQIKGRRVTPSSPSRQLSAIRNYDAKEFDYLVAVIYNEEFNIEAAYLIPHEVIGDYARHRMHVNAHILLMSGAITRDPRIMEISEQLSG